MVRCYACCSRLLLGLWLRSEAMLMALVMGMVSVMFMVLVRVMVIVIVRGWLVLC